MSNPAMLLMWTQPMPRLVASTPHRFEAVTQHDRNVMPASVMVGQLGADGGGGLQAPPLNVPQVLVVGLAQQAGGSVKPGTCGFVHCTSPH